MKMLKMPNGNWINPDCITQIQCFGASTLPTVQPNRVLILLTAGAETVYFENQEEAEAFRDQLAHVVNGATQSRNQVPSVERNYTRAFAEDCVKLIEADLMTRPSLRPGYMSLNGSVCEEIMATWATIIEGKVRSL